MSAGSQLSILKRREEALKATQEAVNIFEHLAESKPEVYRPDLAMALSCLGDRLSELGYIEDALRSTQKVVAIQRSLVVLLPGVFEHDLIMALNSLGKRLSELGFFENALEAAQEAVGAARRLTDTRPGLFERDLVQALFSLGNRFSALGQHGHALKATSAAIAFRSCATEQGPDCTHELPSLSNWRLENRQFSAGLKAAREASNIQERLTDSDLRAPESDADAALTRLGDRVAPIEQPSSKQSLVNQAIGILEKLASMQQKLAAPELAMYCQTLGSILHAHNPEEAAAAFEEGLRTLLPLLEQQPQTHDALATNLIRNWLASTEEAGGVPSPELLAALREFMHPENLKE
jgi:tetratricopeptide (TPR) repeat protein